MTTPKLGNKRAGATLLQPFEWCVVKVVADHQGYAHYFSRAPIPYARDAFAVSRSVLPAGLPALRHIGLYAYRTAFLKQYSMLSPAPAEQFEALEQLRALHHGYRIAVTLWESALPPGVDTPEDLERIRRLLLGDEGQKQVISISN